MIPPVLKISSLKVMDKRRLHVVLSNGKEGMFDISPYLKGEFFSELKNIEYFSRVKTAFGGSGIEWPNGQDLSAYTVEEKMQTAKISK